MNNHDKNLDSNELSEETEQDQVTLTLDDGTELLCDVVAIFPLRDKEYIALLPADADENEEEDSEVFLYEFIQKEDGDIDLINIEDDDEFDEVADAFDEYLDGELFDEMLDDDDEEDEE